MPCRPAKANTCRCLVVAAASTLQPSARAPEAERRARTLSPPPPRTMEQPQACSISREHHGGSVAPRQTPVLQVLGRRGGKHSPTRVPERRARTLSQPPSCTVEQPQACSTSRELHGGSVAKANTPTGASWSGRQALSQPSPIGRDEHGPCVRLRLAPWSSRKLARPVGAPWWLCCKGKYQILHVPGRGGKHSP